MLDKPVMLEDVSHIYQLISEVVSENIILTQISVLGILKKIDTSGLVEWLPYELYSKNFRRIIGR